MTMNTAAPVNDAFIVDVVRTPRGKGRSDGGLHNCHPQDLLAQCLQALVSRSGINPADVEDVIAGNGILSGDHGDDIARLEIDDDRTDGNVVVVERERGFAQRVRHPLVVALVAHRLRPQSSASIV